MKLFLNAASPYARLVRVVLFETGLHAVTELHYVDPWESPPDLVARNPASPAIAASLDALVADTNVAKAVDLADLTLAVALEYVEFRLPQLSWQQDHRQLRQWSAQMGQRPSLSATRPQ